MSYYFSTFARYRPLESFPSFEKLVSFSELPHGWHYGSGEPISANVIEASKQVILDLAMKGFTHTDVFPGEYGDVLVTAYHDAHYLGIVVGADGLYAFNHEIDDQAVLYLEGLDLGALRQQLGNVAGGIWPTSGLFTQKSMTTSKGASMIWRLKGPVAGVCRSSKWSVQRQQAALSATT